MQARVDNPETHATLNAGRIRKTNKTKHRKLKTVSSTDLMLLTLNNYRSIKCDMTSEFY